MGKYTALDKRMKRYEEVTDQKLMRRCPVVARIDGIAFHTFTRGMKKPFDDIFIATMQQTMLSVAKEIPGCVFGYTQSDEITLLLCDYQTLETEAWFDYRVEKLCSAIASKTARWFSYHYMNIVADMTESQDEFKKYAKKFNCADFDVRVFNVPLDDVTNNVVWRQKDAEKNSVQSLAQSLYSQKELSGIKCKSLQDKMFTEKGINWSELPTCKKRGSACMRVEKKWILDLNMPIVSQNRDYVEALIHFE